MRVIVFSQWDRLVAMVGRIAGGKGEEASRYALVTCEPKGGRVKLADRAMNRLVAGDGGLTVELPDIQPGTARDFLLRVEAHGSPALSFVGAEAFESDDDDALAPPEDGETCLYLFTETKGDAFLVSRRKVHVLGEGDA